jgi:hypothetical protein
MKQLNFEQMSVLQGGRTPCGEEVMCFLASVGYGFINPFLGIVAGAACMFHDMCHAHH